MGRIKTVLMLLQSDFPPDIRVEKEAKTLTQSGRFKVHVLCNSGKSLPLNEELSYITVHRLGYKMKLGKKINRVLNYPLWFNPHWVWRGLQMVKKIRPQVIHVHDLPLFCLGFLLSRISKAWLVYDLHENYPATFDLWKKGGVLRPFIRNKNLAMAYDRWSLRKADGVVVVEPEHAEWIGTQYKIKREITVVPNTVSVSGYMNQLRRTEILRKFSDRFVVTYVGKISVERDIEVAIRAIPLVKETIPDLLLLIVGEGPDRKRLQFLCKELQLENSVYFTGWIPFEKTASYIHVSQVCIIPQGRNALIDNGNPHKLYQYMALAKPVLASDAKALKRVVTETKCGLVFKSKDENDFARALLQFAKSKEPFGQNGKNAVARKYNWEFTSKELLRLYERI